MSSGTYIHFGLKFGKKGLKRADWDRLWTAAEVGLSKKPFTYWITQ